VVGVEIREWYVRKKNKRTISKRGEPRCQSHGKKEKEGKWTRKERKQTK